MDANYSSLQTPQFRVLSDHQIERVYQATLECLPHGVNVHNPEARELLAGAGAHVDGVRVRIPAHIIRDALAATPRSFTLWGRDGRQRIQIVHDRVYFGPGPTCTYFIDPETGGRRKTRRGDPGLAALVCDALQNIDYVMWLGLIDDVPRISRRCTSSPRWCQHRQAGDALGLRAREVADIYRIALAVAGSEGAARSGRSSPSSPPTSPRWCTPTRTWPTCSGRWSTISRWSTLAAAAPARPRPSPAPACW